MNAGILKEQGGMSYSPSRATLCNTQDIFKFLAIGFMILDHLGLFFFPSLIELRVIGRMAAPLFMFFIGLRGAYRFQASLAIAGLWITAISWGVLGFFSINLLLVFLAVRYLLSHVQVERCSLLQLSLLFLLFMSFHYYCASFLDYGAFAFLFAIAGRLHATQHSLQKPWLALTLIAYFLYEYPIFHFNRSASWLFLFFIECCILGWMFTRKDYFSPVHFNTSLQAGLRKIARHSFSIYVIHYTLFVFVFYTHILLRLI